MNLELFIAKRIASGDNQTGKISRPIVRIATIGIAIGLVVMILTLAIVTGFQSEIRDKVIGFGSHIQITNYSTANSYEASPISINQSFCEVLRSTKGINHIQAFAHKSGIVKTKKDNEGVLLKGVGKDYDWTFIQNNLLLGNSFSVSDTGISKQIIISKYLASRLGLSIGEKMIIYFLTQKKDSEEFEQRIKDFYISGIYETGFEDIDKKVVLVDIAQLQKLNYWGRDQIAGFEISIEDYNRIDELGDYVNETVGYDFRSETIKETNPTVFAWLDLQDINALIVIALMIIVAGINMITALLILILERTNMIGILKALGQSNGGIQRIFLYNAVYLIGKGLLWGNIIGIAICMIQKKFGLFTLPQETYYVSVIPINLNLMHLLILNIGTIIVCVLMLIIPSFIISRITPVKAIRFS